MTGPVIGLVAALCGQAQPPSGGAAQPVWLNAYEVKVRAAGREQFAGAARVGVEFFRDPPTGAVLAVTDRGRLAVAPAGEPAAGKTPGWLFAHDLKARRPDEELIGPKTKSVGVEAYKDPTTGRLLYLSEAGGVALADAPAAVVPGKGAKWHHALPLKVRGPAEDRFGDKTKQVVVEVYQDENTGGLVYVTDAGAVATAPAPADLKPADPGRKVAFLHGQALRVRKPDEKTYSDTNPRLGLEVYRDPATGHLLYVTEAGGLAVAPAGGVDTGKGFREERGLLLSARPAGESRFDKATRLGVEVLTDNNTGHTLFLTDTGAIAVLPKK